MHSWRVRVLPYLDMDPIYEKYHFDEPWDGPNNRPLLSFKRDIYRCPADRAAGITETSYLAVVGKETLWSGTSATPLSDLVRGSSHTVLLVEQADSGIQWLEPRDLEIDRMDFSITSRSGADISSHHRAGANAVFADGSVRCLSPDTSPEVLKQMLILPPPGPNVTSGEAD